MNFKFVLLKAMLLYVIRVQSFGSHIRLQPPRLGLNQYSVLPTLQLIVL
jgi:hypothetical protein